MDKIVVTLLFFPLSICSVSGQNYMKEAKNHFGEHLNSHDFTKLMLKSLPTLEDCQKVFKKGAAEEYFSYIKSIKSQATQELDKEGETFVDVKIEVFSTQDIELNKGNYAGGMKNLLEKLQPYVIFHKVSLLREKGAEHGMAYKYWVNINGRWVFFLKPYRAF